MGNISWISISIILVARAQNARVLLCVIHFADLGMKTRRFWFGMANQDRFATGPFALSVARSAQSKCLRNLNISTREKAKTSLIASLSFCHDAGFRF
jgi:hypothetical protein